MQNHFKVLLIILTMMISSCQRPEPKHPWLSGNEYERIDVVAEHLRGNDLVMWEVDYRHSKLYNAIVSQNKEYALYQLKKIELSMRKGSERRPKRKPSYEWFFENAIPPMKEAIENGNALSAYELFTSHCVTCHAMEKVPFMPVNKPWLMDTK